jgi:hypothetical protein
MKSERSVASFTPSNFATFHALNERCRASTVEEKDYFPTVLQSISHSVDEPPAEHLEMTIGTLFPHVDDIDFRHCLRLYRAAEGLHASYAIRKLKQSIVSR